MRPLRSRQPPNLLGERVFTSSVEGVSDDRPGEFTSSLIVTPRADALVAVTMEEIPLTPGIVVLASSPDTYTSSSSTVSQISPRRTTFSSYVASVSFSPSDAPTHHSEVSLAPMEQWTHLNSITEIIDLLGHPMFRKKLRVWSTQKTMRTLWLNFTETLKTRPLKTFSGLLFSLPLTVLLAFAFLIVRFWDCYISYNLV